MDPLELYVQRFLLTRDGRYGEPEIFGAEESVPSDVLNGLTIDLSEIFESCVVPGPL